MKSFLINAVALYVLTVIVPAFRISGGLNSFMTAGATLTVLNILVTGVAQDGLVVSGDHIHPVMFTVHPEMVLITHA